MTAEIRRRLAVLYLLNTTR